MSAGTLYRFVDLFVVGIEFTAIQSLYDHQHLFIDSALDKIQATYRSRGYHLDGRDVDAMRSDSDYIMLHLKHDRMSCAVMISPDRVTVEKRRVSPDMFGDVVPICEGIVTSIRESAKETLGTELEQRVTDWLHGFRLVLRLTDPEANNISVVGNLLRGRSPLLRLLPISSLFRLDITLSGVNSVASDRNCWLTVEAPSNENNCQIWLQFDVKAYPPEMATTPDEKQLAFQNLSLGASDIKGSVELFNRLFVAEFLPALLGTHEVQQPG